MVHSIFFRKKKILELSSDPLYGTLNHWMLAKSPLSENADNISFVGNVFTPSKKKSLFLALVSTPNCMRKGYLYKWSSKCICCQSNKIIAGSCENLTI